MKKVIFIITILLLIVSCSKNDDDNDVVGGEPKLAALAFEIKTVEGDLYENDSVLYSNRLEMVGNQLVPIHNQDLSWVPLGVLTEESERLDTMVYGYKCDTNNQLCGSSGGYVWEEFVQIMDNPENLDVVIQEIYFLLDYPDREMDTLRIVKTKGFNPETQTTLKAFVNAEQRQLIGIGGEIVQDDFFDDTMYISFD